MTDMANTLADMIRRRLPESIADVGSTLVSTVPVKRLMVVMKSYSSLIQAHFIEIHFDNDLWFMMESATLLLYLTTDTMQRIMCMAGGKDIDQLESPFLEVARYREITLG